MLQFSKLQLDFNKHCQSWSLQSVIVYTEANRMQFLLLQSLTIRWK